MKKLALLGLLFCASLLTLLYASGSIIRPRHSDPAVEVASQQLVEIDPGIIDVAPPKPEVKVDVSNVPKRKRPSYSTRPTGANSPSAEPNEKRDVVVATLPETPVVAAEQPKKESPPRKAFDTPPKEERREMKRPEREVIVKKEETSEQKLKREIEENRAWRRAKLAEWARQEEERKRNGNP